MEKQKMRLGYCPTMKESVVTIAKNKNYEPVLFSSAANALSALKNKQIDKVLIGRKAKSNEVSKNTKETILKSGYTLVTYKKSIIENTRLSSIEIHTYVSKKIAEKLIPENSNIIYYKSKKQALSKINEGKIVLISWEDWQNHFELFIVMNGGEKVRDFRGEFLYEM